MRRRHEKRDTAIGPGRQKRFSINPGFSDFLRAFSSLFFPSTCLFCGGHLNKKPELLFCPSCLKKIKLIKEPLCHICGKPFEKAAGDNHLCSGCLKKRPNFSMARGIILYDETISRIVHQFKYKRSTVALTTFRALKKSLSHLDELSAADIIIPVPLHPKRLRQRGYNQALLLARHLFPDQKKKIKADLLERSRHTNPQTALSGKARRRNLKQAFAVKNTATVRDKRILLIDDVFTTGTTVNECAGVLKKHGARDVMVLTLARVAD